MISPTRFNRAFTCHVVVDQDAPAGSRLKLFGGWYIAPPPYWSLAPIEVFA